MTMGRPATGSAVGANNHVITHGQSGFLSKTRQDWLDTQRALLNDAQFRAQMGMPAGQRVEQ